MMNRRGPVIGRLKPFDSCIHAPRRDGTSGPDHDPSPAGMARPVRGTQEAAWGGTLPEIAAPGKPNVRRIAGPGIGMAGDRESMTDQEGPCPEIPTRPPPR